MSIRRLRLITGVATALLAAPALMASDISLDWWTIDGGGKMWCAGGDLELSGTVGQPDAGGTMAGGDYTLTGGFWAGPSPYALGDINCDGEVNLFDIDPFVLALTSAGNPDPFDAYYAVWPDCNPMLADVDGDGSVNLFDIDPFLELLTGG